MEDLTKKPRRNSFAQIKMNNIRDSVKCSLSIQPFSAGVRPHFLSCENPIIENEREHTPEKYIQTDNFFTFYEEIKYIGQGGQSIIKKIKRNSDQKLFAAKIYKIQSMEDSECMNSILKEFLNSKALAHQNIMKVYELFSDEIKNEIRIVTEYLKMKSLDHYIKKSHVFSEQEVSKIIYQVLNALIYMHSKGICHRDINPSNIMINLNFDFVKIIDFGISKNFSEIFRKNRRFIKKSVPMYSSVGTISYNAPEMFFGEGYKYDVDVWSLGVVAYQLLCGTLPFYSEYSGVLMELIMACKVEFSSTCQLSVLAKDFCKKLLRKSSEGRLNAEEAIKHPFILVHNKRALQTMITMMENSVHVTSKESPLINRRIEKFRTQILKNLEKNSFSAATAKKKKEETENTKLIKSLKKFSCTTKKKFPIMKIKNFPPFLLDKDFKNFDKLPQCFRGLKSALSIDDSFEEKMKGKDEFDEVKKNSSPVEKISESQNLITSTLL